jgi:hypothetical protein
MRTEQHQRHTIETSLQQNYLDAFRGRFTSLMRWHDLDDFWENLKQQVDDGWYIYHVGDVPPESPVDSNKLLAFISEIDALLHQEHEEDYCGIVYTDDKENPSYIKIFDPNNLGVSCGYSEKPPLPGWILSRIPPIELEEALYPAANRRRWWQRVFE